MNISTLFCKNNRKGIKNMNCFFLVTVLKIYVPKTDRLIANSSLKEHNRFQKGVIQNFLGLVITKVRVHPRV